METVSPFMICVPRVNVRTGWRWSSVEWIVSLTTYRSVLGSYCSPKARSKTSQAAVGSQISGTVESINANIPVGRKDITPPRVFVACIDCNPTVRIRGLVGKLKETLLGANLAES